MKPEDNEEKASGKESEQEEEPMEGEETLEKEMETEAEHVEEELKEEKLEKAEVEKVEEVKPSTKEEVEEEIVEERFYTIPLGKAWLMPPNKRAPKAIRMIRDFVKRHMKLEAEKGEEEETELKKLIISNEVNEKIWSRGIEKPPRKIRIRAAKDKDGNVTVYLAEGD